jgi:hypothetical protein
MNSYKQSSSMSNGMSKSNGQSNGKQANTQQSKPFCKVCFDAGKSEREYTSHFIKSKPGNDGKVVCPYLLSLECSYCKKKEGHTARYCPVLAQKTSVQAAAAKVERKTVVDEDGWETKKSAGKHVQAQQPKQEPQPVKQKKSTLAVLETIILQEEARELLVETKRVEYDTQFPGAEPKKALIKPVLAWGGKKPDWSSIATKPTPPPVKVVQQKQQPQQVKTMQEEDEQTYSYISDGEEEQDQPNSDRAWGWSGDWNDCPN